MSTTTSESSTKTRSRGFTLTKFLKRKSTDGLNEQQRNNGSQSSTLSHSKSLSFKPLNLMSSKTTSSPTTKSKRFSLPKSTSFPVDMNNFRNSMSPTREGMGSSVDLQREALELPAMEHYKRLNADTSKRKREFESVKRKLLGVHKASDDRLVDEEGDYYDEDEDEDDGELQFVLNIDDPNSHHNHHSIGDSINKVANKVHNIGGVPKVMINGSILEHHHPPSTIHNGRLLASSTPEKVKRSPSISDGSIISSEDDDDYNDDDNDNNMGSQQLQNNENGEENQHHSDHEDEKGGIFSKIFSSLNLKSFTDLHEGSGSLSKLPTTDGDEGTGGDDKSDTLTRKQTNGSVTTSGANSITFKPVKKSIIQTLGNGSLSLDEFPETTDNSIIGNSTHANGGLNSLLNPSNFETYGDTVKSIPLSDINTNPLHFLKKDNKPNNKRKSMNPQDLELAKGRLRASTVSEILSGNESRSEISSPLLHSVSSNDLEGLQKKNIMGLKLKLPLKDKLKANIDKFQLSEERGMSLEKKRDYYAGKLDIDIPSEKRQKIFHSLFTDVPSDDLFIAEYACAYRKELFIQGKLYLTEHNVCFHSNIIGLVTHLTIPFNKVYKITKKKTMRIPNAIEFSNLHEKYVFSTFMSRDIAFALIRKVWMANKNIYSGPTGQDLILGVDEDDLESLDPVSEFEYDDDDDDLDEKRDRDTSNIAGGETALDDDNDSDSSLSDANMVKEGEDENVEPDNTGNDTTKFFGLSFQGPKTHPPTNIGYKEESGDVKIIENIITAPLGVVYELLFGDDTGFAKLLILKQGNKDIKEMPKFASNFRKYEYVKPLNAPVGPKQTRCLVEETVDKCDFNDFCLVTQSTASPDVPSGNSFKVRTKIWLSWDKNDCTKLFVVTNVVWSGKSWIKGVIEKNTYSGQIEALGIVATEVKKKIDELKSSGGGLSKKKKKQKQEVTFKIEPEIEPVKEPEPVVEIEKDWFQFIMDQLDVKMVLIIILFIWMTVSSFKKKSNTLDLYNNDRMLSSESLLWDWIEDRGAGVNYMKYQKLGTEAFQKNLKLQDLKEEIEFEKKKLELLQNLASNI